MHESCEYLVHAMDDHMMTKDLQENGLDAVNKINGAPNYFDLILMDIIMPHLDGVSATVCIRETRPTIPVIAMTSNIRADDIDVYFKHGNMVQTMRHCIG